MSNTAYLIDYNLKLLYLANKNIKSLCKEFDFNDMNFSKKYSGNSDLIDCCLEIDDNTFKVLIDSTYNSKFSYELSDSDMEWIIKLESILPVDSNLYNDKKYMFNYIVLKLMLIGFPNELAINFATKYYSLVETGINVPKIYEVINSINNIIDNKTIWIGNEINNYLENEEDFVRDILREKKRLKFDFDFSKFKDDYYNLTETSFINYIYEYNCKKSYLVKNKINLLDDSCKQILLNIFERIIGGIIQYLLSNEFRELESEYRFIDNLKDDLKNVVSIYLHVLDENLKQ